MKRKYGYESMKKQKISDDGVKNGTAENRFPS